MTREVRKCSACSACESAIRMDRDHVFDCPERFWITRIPETGRDADLGPSYVKAVALALTVPCPLDYCLRPVDEFCAFPANTLGVHGKRYRAAVTPMFPPAPLGGWRHVAADMLLTGTDEVNHDVLVWELMCRNSITAMQVAWSKYWQLHSLHLLVKELVQLDIFARPADHYDRYNSHKIRSQIIKLLQNIENRPSGIVEGPDV